jgi:hypothetical protein
MDIVLFGPSRFGPRVFVELQDLDPKAFQSDPLGMYARIMRRLAIRRAADGDHDALDFLLRGFIRKAKQGRDPVAHVVADVLERVFPARAAGKFLAPKPNEGARVHTRKRS